MFLDLCLGERAERDDLNAGGAGVFDSAFYQRLASAFAAQGIRHAGMVDDDAGGPSLE